MNEAKPCLEKAIAWLRRTQDAEGRWIGATRSNHIILYAAGLALTDTHPGAAIVQDICDYVEACASPSGGLAPFPGEPASAFDTCFAVPFLKWARPDSELLPQAMASLPPRWRRFRDPRVLFSEWVFDPASRSHAQADKGPPDVLRRMALWSSRRHPSERWELGKMFPRRYPRPSLVESLLKPIVGRAFTFPPLDRLEEAARLSAMPAGFDMMLLMYAALRRLDNDRSQPAAGLYEFAFQRCGASIFPDGTYHFIGTNVAHLLLSKAFGLDDDFGRAKRAFGGIAYESGGWLRTDSLSTPVWETALTVLALRTAGVPADDPLLERATAYLIKAQVPGRGVWSWEYTAGMGDERALADTDTTGTTCMALAACGESSESPALRRAQEGLLQMQEPSGGFSLYVGMLRPNWVWVSNTSRAVQALIATGLSMEHPPVRGAVGWLLARQNPDSSWLDGWCARYIYGTVVVLETLMRCGVLRTGDAETDRIARWLLSQQNDDGGWGEDWYGGRCHSTAEHTGLALYGLGMATAGQTRPRTSIKAGVRWLCDHQRPDGSWPATYFMSYGFDFGAANTQFPMIWALHGLGAALQALDEEESEGFRLIPEASSESA